MTINWDKPVYLATDTEFKTPVAWIGPGLTGERCSLVCGVFVLWSAVGTYGNQRLVNRPERRVTYFARYANGWHGIKCAPRQGNMKMTEELINGQWTVVSAELVK